MLKQFFSFSGLVRNLKDGSVEQEDVDTGLFYFGCTRRHALSSWNEYWSDAIDVKHLFVQGEDDLSLKDEDRAPLSGDQKFDAVAATACRDRLLAIIKKAEDEGRITWRGPVEHRTFGQYNALLESNGLPRIDGHDDTDRFSPSDIYRNIAQNSPSVET